MDFSDAGFDEEAAGPDKENVDGPMREACEKGRDKTLKA